jgi:hypothetical protein
LEILWICVGVASLALAYHLQFSAATLALGRALSDTQSPTGFQDAITPPWQTNFGIGVFLSALAIIGAIWWQTNWQYGLVGLVAMLVGAAIMLSLLPAPESDYFRRQIVRSMCVRYERYSRRGDTPRALAMKMLLAKLEIDPDDPAEARSAQVISPEDEELTPQPLPGVISTTNSSEEGSTEEEELIGFDEQPPEDEELTPQPLPGVKPFTISRRWFKGDDYPHVQEVQSRGCHTSVRSIFFYSKDAYLKAERLLDIETPVGTILRTRDSFDLSVLQEVHDLIAAWFRLVRADDCHPELPFTREIPQFFTQREWTDETRISWMWSHFLRDELGKLIDDTSFARYVATAVAFENNEEGHAAEEQLRILLHGRYWVPD